MKLKRIISIILALSMIFAIAMTAVSCDEFIVIEDDNDDNKTKKEKGSSLKTEYETETETEWEGFGSGREEKTTAIYATTSVEEETKKEPVTTHEVATTTPGNSDSEVYNYYYVYVMNAGGRYMDDIKISIRHKNTQELIAEGYTVDGVCEFYLPKNTKYYVARVDYLPEGYKAISDNFFDDRDNSAHIVLSTSVIEDSNLDGVTYTLGSVMHDFSVVTTDGKLFNLAETLKEKKCVMINFFYTTCSPCVQEFPYINSVANKYADDVAVIAINPTNMYGETEEAVRLFKEQYNLDIDMAKTGMELADAFGVYGYPTTVFIDRFGTVCLIEVGGMPSETPFKRAFEYFTSDRYMQQLFDNMGELPKSESTSGGDEETSGYKVRVTDVHGNPIEGAWIMVCKGDMCSVPTETDADGYAKFPTITDEGRQAKIAYPIDGYVVDTAQYFDFEDGSFEMTIALWPSDY